MTRAPPGPEADSEPFSRYRAAAVACLSSIAHKGADAASLPELKIHLVK
jgi:hypothetical protein